MNKKIFLFLFSLCFIYHLPIYSQNNSTLEEFREMAINIGVEYSMPNDFTPFELDKNKRKDVNYLYSIKHKNKNIEIRYSLFPYQKGIKEPNRLILSSDKFHKMFTYTVVMNIAGNEKNVEGFYSFKDEDAKKLFNADVAYFAVVKPESTFGKGYNKAVIIGIYKSLFGFSYHTILLENDNIISDEELRRYSFSVKFKNKK